MGTALSPQAAIPNVRQSVVADIDHDQRRQNGSRLKQDTIDFNPSPRLRSPLVSCGQTVGNQEAIMGGSLRMGKPSGRSVVRCGKAWATILFLGTMASCKVAVKNGDQMTCDCECENACRDPATAQTLDPITGLAVDVAAVTVQGVDIGSRDGAGRPARAARQASVRYSRT